MIEKIYFLVLKYGGAFSFGEATLTFFAFFSILLCLSLFITLVALKKGKLPLRIFTVVAFFAIAPLATYSFIDIIGRPRPIDFSIWFNVQWDPDPIVLYSEYIEGKAIYLLLKFEGNPEPVYISLPWREQYARQLEKGQAESEEKGLRLFMRKPSESLGLRSTTTNEPVFYPAPPEPPPIKDAPVVDEKSIEYNNITGGGE